LGVGVDTDLRDTPFTPQTFLDWCCEDFGWKKYYAERTREDRRKQRETDAFKLLLPMTLSVEEYEAYKFPDGLSLPHLSTDRASSITISHGAGRYTFTLNESEEAKSYKEEFFQSLPATYPVKQMREICKKLLIKMVMRSGTTSVRAEMEGEVCVFTQMKENKVVGRAKLRV
jgi:hypothetical protein